MKASWLVGIFFVVLAGVWMGTNMHWQKSAEQLGSGPGLSRNTYSPFQSMVFNEASALETADCICCHRNTSERHHQLRERAILLCSECHKIVFDPITLVWKAEPNPDCANCHLAEPGSDRHYLSDVDVEKCRECHEVFLDDAAQAYYLPIIKACDPSDPGTLVSHYGRHMQPAPAKCNSCHQCDLFDVHNAQCLLCHRSPRPEVQAAIQNNDVRCMTCHTDSPHSLQCTICHGTIQGMMGPGMGRTYQPEERNQIHMIHIRYASCGICHMIPQKTNLEPTGEHCAFCHGTPRSYTMSQLPSLHRRHARARGYYPFSCYMCHGKSFPLIPPTQCFPCHDDKTYDFSMREQIHYTHNRIFDCSNCHPQPWLFDVSQSNDCERCHSLRTYSSPVAVHRKHVQRQCWSCHSAREVSAKAGTGCTHCHTTPPATSSPRIHAAHTDEGLQCWVCHDKVVPIYLSTCQPCDAFIEGTVRDDSGNPLDDAVVVAVPGGYTALTKADGTYALCVISETLYSIAAYRSNHDRQMQEVQVAPLQTIYLDFTLKALPPVSMDTDGDGLPDDVENTIGTDPTKQDTDGDGMTDYNEVAYDGDPTSYTPGADLNPLDIDTDKDGFLDGYDGKILLQDYPTGIDRNDDGYVDGEIALGTEPLYRTSFPADGDLNNDGMTDVGDMVLAQRMAMGFLMPTATDIIHGNIAPLANIDGELNVADVLVIYRKTMQ